MMVALSFATGHWFDMTSKSSNATLAIVMVLTGMFILGAIDNTVRLLADTISLWQFHFLRSSLALLVLFGFMAMRGHKLYAHRWWAVIVRSGFLSLAMVVYFGCLGFLPIADTAAGLFSAPILVVVITAFFLKEKIGWVRWVAAILGFAGTLIVIKGADFPIQTVNPIIILQSLPVVFRELGWLNLIPVLGGLFYALGGIATRELCEEETTLSMLFTYVAMMGVIGGIGVVAVTVFPVADPDFLTRPWSMPDRATWMILIIQAVGSLAGVACLIKAYQVWLASYVAVFEYSMLIFASAFAWLAFGEALSRPGIAGIALIILAGAVIALRTRDKPAPAPAPRKSI